MYATLEILFRNRVIFFLFLAVSISYPLQKRKKGSPKAESCPVFQAFKSENQNWFLEMKKQIELFLEQRERS